MQDTLDITGADYEYDFIWLYTLETGSSICVAYSERMQYRSTA